MNVPSLIDHTLLKPDISHGDIKNLCREAVENGFCSVCVNPVNVPLAVQSLEGGNLKICTVVGFPLGANLVETKIFEARKSFEQGATEVDMVINLGAIKVGNYDIVEKEIKEVKRIAADRVVKVIIETGYLTEVEKIRLFWLIAECGADFAAISTGFGPTAASPLDVKLLKRTVGKDIGVKASGSIKDIKRLITMVNAGADRIGTCSSMEIINELKEKERI